VSSPAEHHVRLVRCSRHGIALEHACEECRGLLTEAQWATRLARAAGEVFSVPLCRAHGCPVGTCCLTGVSS
jgi:hypothetical protein